ncbi:helix-turn-helix domain-containing protein [Flavobacterium caeni]|nr:helix-turn-helix transcriptional regulator [Flavobacterium caeni]
MKRSESTPSKMLGIKQSDLALMLGVSRSQMAMFDSGRRSLPVEALQRLAEIRKDHDALKAAQLNDAALAAERRKQLEELLAKNRHGQVYNQGKVEALTKQLQQRDNFRALAELDMQRRKGQPQKSSFPKPGAAADKLVRSLVEFQIRLERQQHEQKWLESQLREK